MMQQRALGKTGSTRSVLDHHRIHRANLGQWFLRSVARSKEFFPIVEANDLAQLGTILRRLLRGREHLVAAEIVDDEDTGGARLLQHIFDLGEPKRRVDRHQHQPGEGAAKFAHHPLGNIRRPHRDAFAGLEVLLQRSRGAQRLF